VARGTMMWGAGGVLILAAAKDINSNNSTTPNTTLYQSLIKDTTTHGQRGSKVLGVILVPLTTGIIMVAQLFPGICI
jgi:hypothetical protein